MPTSPSKTTFRSLPLELRQAVYHLAATDLAEDREIRIKFTLSKDTTDGYGEFEAPTLALDLLDSLQQVSSELHQEAIAYLTSPLFCWVFISQEQPHMYLLRALRKHAQGQLLRQINHVRLEGVAVMDLVYPDPFDVDFSKEMEPAYLARSRQEDVEADPSFRSKVLRDIGYGLSLLPYLLRSLRRLDLDLDIIDCYRLVHYRDQYVFIGNDLKKIPDLDNAKYWMKGMIDQLVSLGNIQKLDLGDVHVFWKNTGLQKRLPIYHFSEEAKAEMQKIFIEAVNERLVARSITGHA